MQNIIQRKQNEDTREDRQNWFSKGLPWIFHSGAKFEEPKRKYGSWVGGSNPLPIS